MHHMHTIHAQHARYVLLFLQTDHNHARTDTRNTHGTAAPAVGGTVPADLSNQTQEPGDTTLSDVAGRGPHFRSVDPAKHPAEHAYQLQKLAQPQNLGWQTQPD